MSNDDPTYAKSGFTYPYPYVAYTPYYGTPKIPPPPPQAKHPVKWIVLLCSVLGILITASLLTAWLILKQRQTTASTDYTATTIVQDFLANHLPVVSPNYSETLNAFTGSQVTTVSAKSELSFIDPTVCNGPCDTGGTWLGVYGSLTDAETANNDIRNFNVYNTNTPYVLTANQHGRCIIVGQPPTSAYVLVINTDCT